MVISRGKIVERGKVEQVLVNPSHPYTQMLLASIPVPDPDARWTPSRKLWNDKRPDRGTMILQEDGISMEVALNNETKPMICCLHDLVERICQRPP